MKKTYWIIALLMLFCTSSLQAQVVVEDPEKTDDVETIDEDDEEDEEDIDDADLDDEEEGEAGWP